MITNRPNNCERSLFRIWDVPFPTIVKTMLYNLLVPFSQDVSLLNVFRYITFRSAGALICALLFSCHILVIEKVSKDSDGVELSLFQFLFGGILCSLGMLAFEKPEISSIMDASIPIAYAGLLSCGVAYTLQTVAQKYVQASKATLALSLESVWAAIGGALLLSERLSMNELIGCTLVFGAVLLAQLDLKPNTASQSD